VSNVNTEPSSLTLEGLQKALDQIYNAPPRVCGVTEPHVVHPKANGWTNCANCAEAVKVRDENGMKVVDRDR